MATSDHLPAKIAILMCLSLAVLFCIGACHDAITLARLEQLESRMSVLEGTSEHGITQSAWPCLVPSNDVSFGTIALKR